MPLSRTRLATIVLAAGLLAPAASAQIPAATAYVGLVTSIGSSTTTGLFGFDTQGNVTTLERIPGPTPRAVEMLPGQDALLVWGPFGTTVYELATGATRVSTLAPAGDLIWGFLDEDLGIVWYTAAGDLYRADDVAGTGARRIARLPSASGTATRNGTTGGFVATIRSGFSVDLGFFDRSGAERFRTPAGIGATGLDWSPWRGEIVVSAISGPATPDLRRVSQSGIASTIPTVGPLFGMTYAVDVAEQPVESYLCAKSGSNPDRLFRVAADGAATTIGAVRMATLDLFADVLTLGDRTLWGAGPWRAGGDGRLTVDFGVGEAGRPYRVALSFGHAPGIPLGRAGTTHIAPDGLFTLSLTAPTALFENFAGVLDSSGRPPAVPTVHIPPLGALIGVRVFAACVTFDATGPRRASSAWGISIG